MHSADVIGYHIDGGAVCADCFDAHPIDDETLEASGGVVFAERESEFIGSTCQCGSCYGPDGWSEAPCDPKQWRWTRCPSCNSQRPYSRTDTDARYAAITNALACESCGESTHF